ncbi:MAG TPA: phage tail assembly chaperone [Allosphingosinicella sp.]|nr:phage tail assembly chaperone [Allosphingosinicella sp.]
MAGALLGWRPDEFWRATPAEMAAIFAALIPDNPASLTRTEMARLEERFPDG